MDAYLLLTLPNGGLLVVLIAIWSMTCGAHCHIAAYLWYTLPYRGLHAIATHCCMLSYLWYTLPYGVLLVVHIALWSPPTCGIHVAGSGAPAKVLQLYLFNIIAYGDGVVCIIFAVFM